MEIRSLELLRVPLAWKRVLWWARERMEIADRLPFELFDRVSDGSPVLGEEHVLRPVQTVLATKSAGTMRPFARLDPRDLLLYQALVDALATTIEATLMPRDRVFGYRQSLDESERPFEGSPGWAEFTGRALDYIGEHPQAYALRADISGFFLQVQVSALEERLYEAGAVPGIVRDLGEFLNALQSLGVRGLPQGVAASSPIANLYLNDLDRFLEGLGAFFVRYVDDLWIFAASFSDARRVQNAVESHLYNRGLLLSGEKSRIYRADTARTVLETARARIAQRRQLFHEGVEIMLSETYAPEDPPDPADVDVAAVIDVYDDIRMPFRANEYPVNLRPTLREVYRELGAVRRTDALADVPEVVLRCPDLTGDAITYAAYCAEPALQESLDVFREILRADRFHRDVEKLRICQAALLLPAHSATELAQRFADMARADDHPLVRARALLAWGLLSDEDEFSLADETWRNVPEWRGYTVVAIQSKDRAERDERYALWSEASEGVRELVAVINQGLFSWRRI